MSKFGECRGYTGKPCIKCGRYRVEHFSTSYQYRPIFPNGFDICEKCRWCPQLDNYVSDDEFYEDDF